MEHGGTLSLEWNSFHGVSTEEEADFMAQLLAGNYSSSCQNDQDPCLTLGTPSSMWPSHESSNMAGHGHGHGHENDQTSYYCSDNTVNSGHHVYYYSQENNYNGRTSIFLPTPGHESYNLNESDPNMETDISCLSMNFCTMNQQNSCTSSHKTSYPDNVIEDPVCMKLEMSSYSLEDPRENHAEDAIASDRKILQKRKSGSLEPEATTEDDNTNNTESLPSPKKKSRSSYVPKNKKNAHAKKNQKGSKEEEEDEADAGLNKHSSSCSGSEDESNAPQEPNGGSVSKTSKKSGALNLSGKTRASRGSATDPQSLYARKRRERINERLRILQNLVPNGTKVDISTMLEEAVEYVKFLQLQIKLLSSDDLWMYAPIAYNGMDIGLDRSRHPTAALL
ncbi:hypothetical protein MKW98_031922 [Papaver atlanticum]|uniref:BHLH domain-containing protein n=1 Tax=Papaver atlanticum TaxID=357466 RepID=A0AAD4SDW7_9MAGN|nr:hypothetical protein MKW98_031922 [Papaver atlanticum]